MKIQLIDGQFGWDYIIAMVPCPPTVQGPLAYDHTNSMYVSSDWDYPGVASTFGWSPCHDNTDGTVDCPDCGKSRSELMAEAQDYLDEHILDIVDDPGYFD